MKKILILMWLSQLAVHVSSFCQNINTIVGTGVAGYSGDGGPAVLAQLNRPINVKFDNVGNMYIPDDNNNVVRKVNSSGIITTVVGNGYGAGSIVLGGYTGDGGPATAAELWGPVDIAFDALGNLYIADNGNAVIRKVNTSGIITTIAGGGTSGLGDGGPATGAELNDPLGIVFDNAGNLYFSDAGNHRVRKINSLGNISTIAGTGINGFSGDGGAATLAQLSIPQFLAITSSGDLYISDWVNHRVRMVNSLGVISTVAGNGMLGNSGDGGIATVASIDGPDCVIFDNIGDFFISNAIDCSIRKINTSGIISTVVGNDICGYGGDGGQATAAEINPEAICSYVDAGGNLYIADSKNNRIRRVGYNNTAINNIPNPPQNITIYPNPAHDQITITAPGKIETVTITNVIGQVVASPPPLSKGEGVLVNVSGYAAGVYFIKVNGGSVGKFVKE